MVKISNGEVTQFVSRGAYETHYKKLGFEIIGSHKVSKRDTKNVEHVNTQDNTFVSTGDSENYVNEDTVVDEFEELLEKPLSQWTNDELRSFTNAKGIDTASAKKASDVRYLVKKYLENVDRNATE